MKHFEQQTSSTLCSVLYLAHPKIKFHISKLWQTQIWHVCCSGKTKKQNKKPFKKTAFRSGLPICHELWDIAFIFFSLTESPSIDIHGVRCDLDRKHWCILSSMGARTLNLGDSVFLYTGRTSLVPTDISQQREALHRGWGAARSAAPLTSHIRLTQMVVDMIWFGYRFVSPILGLYTGSLRRLWRPHV